MRSSPRLGLDLMWGAVRSAEYSEERPDIVGHVLGNLEGREVAALLEPAPVHDVRVVPFREDSDGLEVVGEHRDAGRRGVDECGLGRGGRGVVEVGPGHASGRVGEPGDAYL